MRYVPTNNLLFMKCFASPQNHEVLKGFIKDVLGIPIAGLTIENPYNIEHIEERLAHTIVDVLARLSDESLVTIEMQIQPRKRFLDRTAYYTSSRYTAGYGDRRFLPKDTNSPDALYASLRPVHGINICDFDMFEDNTDPLRTFTLFDVAYQTEFPRSPLNISFFQLNKTPLKHQVNLKHWITFFKGEAPAADAPEYIVKAYQVVEYNNLNEKERAMIDYAEMSRADTSAMLEYARDEGITQGVAQGIAQGRQEGIFQTALRMLERGMTINDIREITGLDAEDLKKLQEN
jgi:predicted transposase/invertase (TIGR01784 family)